MISMCQLRSLSPGAKQQNAPRETFLLCIVDRVCTDIDNCRKFSCPKNWRGVEHHALKAVIERDGKLDPSVSRFFRRSSSLQITPWSHM